MKKILFVTLACIFALITPVNAKTIYKHHQPQIHKAEVPPKKQYMVLWVEDTTGNKLAPLNQFYTKSYDFDPKTNTFYFGEIDQDMYVQFYMQTMRLVVEKATEITIDVNSPGGALEFAYAISEQIRMLEDSGIHVTTRINERNSCMSACPMIFAQGQTRQGDVTSVIMIHAPYIRGIESFPLSMQRVLETEIVWERTRFTSYFKPKGMFKRSTCSSNWLMKMLSDGKDNFFTAPVMQKSCGGNYFTEIGAAKP